MFATMYPSALQERWAAFTPEEKRAEEINALQGSIDCLVERMADAINADQPDLWWVRMNQALRADKLRLSALKKS